MFAKTRNVCRKYGARMAAVAAVPALAIGQAHAAIDTTAATGGITEAQTAVLAVVAALTTMLIAVWGVKKVAALFGR